MTICSLGEVISALDKNTSYDTYGLGWNIGSSDLYMNGIVNLAFSTSIRCKRRDMLEEAKKSLGKVFTDSSGVVYKLTEETPCFLKLKGGIYKGITSSYLNYAGFNFRENREENSCFNKKTLTPSEIEEINFFGIEESYRILKSPGTILCMYKAAYKLLFHFHANMTTQLPIDLGNGFTFEIRCNKNKILRAKIDSKDRFFFHSESRLVEVANRILDDINEELTNGYISDNYFNDLKSYGEIFY